MYKFSIFISTCVFVTALGNVIPQIPPGPGAGPMRSSNIADFYMCPNEESAENGQLCCKANISEGELISVKTPQKYVDLTSILITYNIRGGWTSGKVRECENGNCLKGEWADGTEISQFWGPNEPNGTGCVVFLGYRDFGYILFVKSCHEEFIPLCENQ